MENKVKYMEKIEVILYRDKNEINCFLLLLLGGFRMEVIIKLFIVNVIVGKFFSNFLDRMNCYFMCIF